MSHRVLSYREQRVKPIIHALFVEETHFFARNHYDNYITQSVIKSALTKAPAKMNKSLFSNIFFFGNVIQDKGKFSFACVMCGEVIQVGWLKENPNPPFRHLVNISLPAGISFMFWTLLCFSNFNYSHINLLPFLWQWLVVVVGFFAFWNVIFDVNRFQFESM